MVMNIIVNSSSLQKQRDDLKFTRKIKRS